MKRVQAIRGACSRCVKQAVELLAKPSYQRVLKARETLDRAVSLWCRHRKIPMPLIPERVLEKASSGTRRRLAHLKAEPQVVEMSVEDPLYKALEPSLRMVKTRRARRNGTPAPAGRPLGLHPHVYVFAFARLYPELLSFFQGEGGNLKLAKSLRAALHGGVLKGVWKQLTLSDDDLEEILTASAPAQRAHLTLGVLMGLQEETVRKLVKIYEPLKPKLKKPKSKPA